MCARCEIIRLDLGTANTYVSKCMSILWSHLIYAGLNWSIVYQIHAVQESDIKQ